jgi:hypothetical protein
MKVFLPVMRIERVLPWLGSAGSTIGGLAVMCCLGWSGLATLLPTLGLGYLVYVSNARRLIFIALAISALGLALSLRRHRRSWPLLAAVAGAGLLLYPFYHALDVTLWLGMVYSGLVLLVVAAGLDGWLAYRAGRACKVPSCHPRRKFQLVRGVKFNEQDAST